jgi:gamma-glutamyltranspeptidase / glutathione hydrolase
MPQQMIAKSAAVATGHPLGAAAGVEVLRHGGNAIDAAVAAMLAMCVVVPGSVGLGGYGGSAVLSIANGREEGARRQQPRTIAVDFDSCAPLAFRDGLVTSEPDSNYYGARSVTVPAVVAGLDLILREFGRKSWQEVSQPAIALAEEGFEFDAEHERYLDRCAPKFDKQSLTSLFGSTSLPRSGDRWRQPQLAKLLRRLADKGAAYFYEGEIAQQIVRYLSERGGILSEEDFRSYHPQFVGPVQIEVLHRAAKCPVQLYTPPPPSGGITSLEIIQTAYHFDDEIEPWSGRYFHLLAETFKLCWLERHNLLGDPDFVGMELDELLSNERAKARAKRVQGNTPLHFGQASGGASHTANVIAADSGGNLISLTATQGWMYGSHLVVDGLGLVLNHGMSRFEYAPGHPNAPAPGKRMQHNMAPLIGVCDGKPLFAAGLPGGPKIVSVTAQLALRTLAFGESPTSAIAAPRLHTEIGEPLLVSQHMPDGVIAELENLGHRVRREPDMGGPVNVLTFDRQTGHIDTASGETTGAVAGIG